jgi:hypothetical protein
MLSEYPMQTMRGFGCAAPRIVGRQVKNAMRHSVARFG